MCSIPPSGVGMWAERGGEGGDCVDGEDGEDGEGIEFDLGEFKGRK